MATFPSNAKLLFEGFTERPASAVLRTEMESGPPKQAKLVSRVMVPRPVRYLFASKADYQAFVTWFRTQISYGADWFDWTDPVDGTVKSARIVNGTYEPTPLRKNLERWVVAMDLETWG